MMLLGPVLFADKRPVVRLVAAAREGDQRAFSQLVDAYNRQVASVVMSEFLCSADELQDVLQEVWVAAWQSLPSLKDTERFGGWLYALARNRARTLRKRCRREEDHLHRPVPQDDEADDPLESLHAVAGSDPANTVGAQDILRAALEQLPPKERTAFTLRVVVRPPWEYEQIGEAMGGGTVAARVAYSRACKRLAGWWQKEFQQ